MNLLRCFYLSIFFACEKQQQHFRDSRCLLLELGRRLTCFDMKEYTERRVKEINAYIYYGINKIKCLYIIGTYVSAGFFHVGREWYGIHTHTEWCVKGAKTSNTEKSSKKPRELFGVCP